MTKFSITVLLVLFSSFQIHMVSAGKDKVKQEAGRIVDTVKCKINSKYSYALYLPDNYSDTIKWPVIFVFDPAARGSLAVSGFVKVAESLGFIIVGSNNSKNMLPWDELYKAVNFMIIDVDEKLSIDNRRIYTSGFSGGSRVASKVALQNKIISGVIACGAGFPENTDFKNIPPFDYFGLVGNRDMNCLEMCDLKKKLETIGKTVELEIFDGGHDWPSPGLLQEAVEWLELRSMNKGIKTINYSFVNAKFEKCKYNAELLLKQGKLTEAVQRYESTIRDFPCHNGIIKIKEKLDSLQQSKAYIKSLKNLNKYRELERETKNTLVSTLINQVRSESLPDSISRWMAGQIKTLRNMEKNKDTNYQVISSRVIGFLNTVCLETGWKYFNLKKFRAASIYFEVEAMIEPENNYIQFLLAKTYALDNDINSSIRSLENAVKLGYNNRQSVEMDPAFIELKKEKRFREVMMRLN